MFEGRETGLHLLAAPNEPVGAHLPDPEQTAALIRRLRRDYRFIVVDLPKILNGAARVTLGLADLVLHLVVPELIAVRQVSYAQRVLNDPAYRNAQQAVILNHVVPDAQLPRSAVERALQQKVVFEIGFDRAQRAAVIRGQLVHGGSPLPSGIEKVAAALRQRASMPAIFH